MKFNFLLYLLDPKFAAMTNGEWTRPFNDFLCPDCERSSLYEDCAANLTCSCGYRGNWLNNVLSDDKKIDVLARIKDIERLKAAHYKLSMMPLILALVCFCYSLLPFLGVPESLVGSPLKWVPLIITIPVGFLSAFHALNSWLTASKIGGQISKLSEINKSN